MWMPFCGLKKIQNFEINKNVALEVVFNAEFKNNVHLLDMGVDTSVGYGWKLELITNLQPHS